MAPFKVVCTPSVFAKWRKPGTHSTLMYRTRERLIKTYKAGRVWNSRDDEVISARCYCWRATLCLIIAVC